MKIDVYYQNVYGNQLCYPYCEVAKKFLRLISNKTFSDEQLKTIKSLGYEINVVAFVPEQRQSF
jgi:hypothetical protein|tara:strand:- start:2407 stop:2598 length:192 start_codon:yes stop_codon:yes gene_type:complete